MPKPRVYLSFLLFVLGSTGVGWAQGVISLPWTGQGKCYNASGAEILCAGTGQDGDTRTGVSWPDPRFTVTYCDDNGPCPGQTADCDGNSSNDVVMDNLTGLMWARNGNLFGWNPHWWDAVNMANNLVLCGYSDWRMPNVNELESLVNSGAAGQGTWLNSQGFAGPDDFYPWSSSTYYPNSAEAWIVHLGAGYVVSMNEGNNQWLWPVRLGQSNDPDPNYPANIWKTGQPGEMGVSWPDPRFTDNRNGTVTDNLTGLVWLKNADCFGAQTWSQALSDANSLSSGQCDLADGSQAGKWRLANRKELYSLINHWQMNPALPTGYPFTNVQWNYYWSSSTMDYPPYRDNAWGINISAGHIWTFTKDTSHYVWPVRNECTEPPSGLVAWWPGDNSAIDIAGNNNGTLMSGATFAPGRVGQAFSFSGATDSFVEIPNSAEFNPSGAFSVDGWFYIDPAANAGKIATLVAKTEGSWGNGWAIYFDDRGIGGFSRNLQFIISGVAVFHNAIPVANWYHVAGVFDPSTTPNIKLYLNGTVVASANGSVGSSNGLNVRIGAMYWTDQYHQGNDRLNGKADEVEFFNRALTAEEITAIYSAGGAGKCRSCVTPPSGMVSWWKGEDNANDSLGVNNGTLVNGVAFAGGRVGRAFSLDGVDDYVQVPAVVNNMPQGTIQGWIRYSDSGPGILFSATSGVPLTGDYDAMVLGVMTPFGASIVFGIYPGGSSWYSADSGVVPDPNRWYHVAGTWGAGGMRIYVDGVLKGTHSYDGASSPASYNLIGASSWGYSVKGLIDEVELFNRALSAEEIAFVYAAGSAGICPIDQTGPSLAITSHTNNQDVNTASITLIGTASDSGRGDNGIQQVTVNGVRANNDTATGSGTANWSKTVSLNPGANTLTVVAYDNSSNPNQTSQTITVYYDLVSTIYVSKDGVCNGHSHCWPNIQNGIGNAPDLSIIEVTQDIYDENIVLDVAKEIMLQGGWDTNFTSCSSYTTIQGSITITNGTIIIENIILQ